MLEKPQYCCSFVAGRLAPDVTWENVRNPKGSLSLAVMTGDAEITYFAAQLAKLVEEAGWMITERKTWADLTGFGVFVRARNSQNVPSQGGILQRTLTKVGITADGEASSLLREDELELLVAHRPIQPPKE